MPIDSKELNAMIQKEAQRDKTYSKTMESDGAYIQGENLCSQGTELWKKGLLPDSESTDRSYPKIPVKGF